MSEKLDRPCGSELIGRVRQHTPGPWHWEDGEFSALPRLMAQAVEVCNFGDREQYYPTEGLPPEDEDARLIAASPELLAALRKCLVVLHPDTDEFKAASAAVKAASAA